MVDTNTPVDMIEGLLPCPSGHQSPRRDNNNIYGAWWVKCSESECSWRTAGHTEAEAVAAWNTRTDSLTSLQSRVDCSCAEIAGEDPECQLHGRRTQWTKENPDIYEMADRIADLKAALTAAADALDIEGKKHDCPAALAAGVRARTAVWRV